MFSASSAAEGRDEDSPCVDALRDESLPATEHGVLHGGQQEGLRRQLQDRVDPLQADLRSLQLRDSETGQARPSARAVRARGSGPRTSAAPYLLQQTLPHLLHVHRLFSQGEVGNGAEQRGLGRQLLDALLQPLVPVNAGNRAQQGLPFVLRKPVFTGLPYSC